MKKILVVALALAALTGCSAIAQVSSPIDRVTLEKGAYTAKAGYVAAATIAAEVVKLPRCEWAPAPCVPQAAVDQIRLADTVTKKTVDETEAAARSLTADPTALKLLVDNASKAVALFKFAADTYKVPTTATAPVPAK